MDLGFETKDLQNGDDRLDRFSERLQGLNLGVGELVGFPGGLPEELRRDRRAHVGRADGQLLGVLVPQSGSACSLLLGLEEVRLHAMPELPEFDLAAIADPDIDGFVRALTGLAIHVHHYPPGTSKWNRIEHRLFCRITQNWRGRPLTDRLAVVEFIGATTTTAGLKVASALDTRRYQKASKSAMPR